MTFLVKRTRNHKGVVFRRRAMGSRTNSDLPASSSSTLEQPHGVHEQPQHPGFVIEVPSNQTYLNPFSSSPSTSMNMSARTTSIDLIPDLFTSYPPLRDQLRTKTSDVQDETVQECLPFLSGVSIGGVKTVQYNSSGVPHLERQTHIQFLHKSLRKLPAPYVAADASRPWMFYWALNALSTMGEDISQYKNTLISTVRPIQNTTGGFGGGNGQMSHLAPTYAIILSLAIVGGKEAFDVIDRRAMWKWLGSLKQPDGGFQMAVGGEEDVR
jgi:protein farnesyltransferase subunit beta